LIARFRFDLNSVFSLLHLAHHHAEEFLVVDHAILVLVNLANHVIDFIVRQCLILRLQTHPQFIRTYSAAAVLVEVLEGLLDLKLLRVVLGVHARCNELSVIDDTVVVRIDYLHSFFDVIDAHLDLGNLLNTLDQLLVSERSVAVLVDFRECRAQLLDLGLRNPRGDVSHGALLELVLINIRFDVADHFRVQLDEIVLLVALALNPRMVEGLLAGKPNVRGSLEQFCDQILRLVAHLLPHLGFHAVFTVEHVIDDVFVRFTAEGRLAAKHNVHDYTH
jgi:hypothetical protein